MGEWKILLGYDDRELKGFQGADGRMARIYQIVTRDQYCFIINDYEKVAYDGLYEKKNPKTGEMEKSFSNVLIINGEYYRKYGTAEKSYSDFNGIIQCFIENWKLHTPEYDIVEVKDAIRFFKEIKQLKSELLGLDV